MPERPYTGGRFALELDGAHAGFLASTTGGLATADVVTQNDGGDGPFAEKHLGNVRYDDIAFTAGADVAPELTAWLASLLSGTRETKNGAILRLDATYKTVERLEFTNALLTEVGFPALDGTSRDAAMMTARLAPEQTRRVAGDGAAVSAGGTTKQWTATNFRLAIDGLDCKKAMRVEPVVVRATAAAEQVGEERIQEKELTGFEIGDLVVTFPEASANDVFAWHEDFVVKGNSSDDRERDGTLELLTSTMDAVVMTLTFRGLGIYKLSRPPAAPVDSVAKLTASMYCEQLEVVAR